MTARVPGPFKGLASFEDSELDALLFFGREREREIIVANLMASRLTVLYGDTGVGKSSVLRAGVARDLRDAARAARGGRLRRLARRPGRARCEARIAEAVGRRARTARSAETRSSSARPWRAARSSSSSTQLEEYFLYHGDEARSRELSRRVLAQAVTRPGLRASFLLAIREDALAKLDRFKGRDPERARQLPAPRPPRPGARRARRSSGRSTASTSCRRTRPSRSSRRSSRPCSTRSRPARSSSARPAAAASRRERRRGRIEAPFLQLVMARLWDDERGGGLARRCGSRRSTGSAAPSRSSATISSARSTSLDRGAAGRCGRAMFNHLVTPSGTKIAHDAADLAGYVGADQADVEPVLSSLAARADPAPGAGRPRVGSPALRDLPRRPRRGRARLADAARVRTRARARPARTRRVATGGSWSSPSLRSCSPARWRS